MTFYSRQGACSLVLFGWVRYGSATGLYPALEKTGGSAQWSASIASANVAQRFRTRFTNCKKRYADAERYELMALNVAASLLEGIHLATTGNLPEVVARWTIDNYHDVPDTFEVLAGRLRPKHWKTVLRSRYVHLGGGAEAPPPSPSSEQQ